LNQLNRLAISNDNFVFDPVTGKSFTINPTAKDAIEFLAKDNDLENLVAYFVSKYQLSEQEAFNDVMDFISKLQVFQLWKE
jgi:hypothetical protein